MKVSKIQEKNKNNNNNRVNTVIINQLKIKEGLLLDIYAIQISIYYVLHIKVNVKEILKEEFKKNTRKLHVHL